VTYRLAITPGGNVLFASGVSSALKPVADDCDARPGDGWLLDSRPVSRVRR
jgi:hypothetical protein